MINVKYPWIKKNFTCVIDPAAAQRQFDRFAAFYQGDVLEARPLFAREAAQLQAEAS